MQPIDILHLLMALLLGLTAIQRYKKQSESFYIRSILCAWFAMTTLLPLPVEIVRNGSALGITVMLLFEYTAPHVRQYWERR